MTHDSRPGVRGRAEPLHEGSPASGLLLVVPRDPVGAVGGYFPGLPPVPPALGLGAEVPDRRLKGNWRPKDHHSFETALQLRDRLDREAKECLRSSGPRRP